MIADRIYEVINFLNEVDETEKELRDKVSEMDLRQQDLLHYLEGNVLKNYEYIRLSVELKKVREERRKAKNDLAVISEFKRNSMQLQNSKGREALKNIIRRQEKVNSYKYRNRVYKDEELNLIVKKEEKSNYETNRI